MRVEIRHWPSGKPVLPRHVDTMAKAADGRARFGVVQHLTVEVQKDDWGHYVKAQLMLWPSEGRYYTRGVKVAVSSSVMSVDRLPNEHSTQEVTGVLLRTVRMAEIARLGALGGIFLVLDEGQPPVSLLQWLGPEQRYAGEAGDVVRQMGPVRSNLEILALHYHAAQLANEHPAKAVERLFGLPARTAAYWISKAKTEGLLDPLEFEPFSPPERWRRDYREPYETRWPDG